MNKTQLIEQIANDTPCSKREAERALNATLDAIQDAVAEGDKVQIPGFGSFEKKHTAARQGRNPKTGETMLIAASNTVKFKPAQALKDAMN